jgi:hypothetical protein
MVSNWMARQATPDDLGPWEKAKDAALARLVAAPEIDKTLDDIQQRSKLSVIDQDWIRLFEIVAMKACESRIKDAERINNLVRKTESVKAILGDLAQQWREAQEQLSQLDHMSRAAGETMPESWGGELPLEDPQVLADLPLNLEQWRADLDENFAHLEQRRYVSDKAATADAAHCARALFSSYEQMQRSMCVAQGVLKLELVTLMLAMMPGGHRIDVKSVMRMTRGLDEDR